MSDTSVRQELVVAVPVERAFAVFTTHFDTWWPRGHYLGDEAPVAIVLEPREGGRWYQRSAGGAECDWGAVLAWEPPHRLLLAWRISADWQPDPDPTRQTEIEVRFVPDGDTRTRVEFEHRLLDRFGDRAEKMRDTLAADDGWPGILAEFAEAANAAVDESSP